MSGDHRRDFLKKSAGAAFVGTGLAASTSVGADENEPAGPPEIPPLPDADAAEDWASYRAGPGNAAVIHDGREFDGDALETAWSVEIPWRLRERMTVAVRDDTVFAGSEDGAVALDAEDGTVDWVNETVAGYNPTVAYDAVYLNTDEGVVALRESDGSVEWTLELYDTNEGGQLAVSDETLYLLDWGEMHALRELEDNEGSEPDDDDGAGADDTDGDDEADDPEETDEDDC